MPRIKDYSLYLVISQEYAQGKNALKIAEEAIAGGADIIQMREKDKSYDELIVLGNKLRELCKKSGVIFIVNDLPVIAKEVDADGVHLGQEDLKKYSLKEVRKIVGADKIIGISTHSLEQFKKANNQDFDYIAFGPVFSTQTKNYFIGTSKIEDVLKIATKPIVFIGGINFVNIDEILTKKGKIVAMIRSILQADDVYQETKKFKQKLIEAKNKCL